MTKRTINITTPAYGDENRPRQKGKYKAVVQFADCEPVEVTGSYDFSATASVSPTITDHLRAKFQVMVIIK